MESGKAVDEQTEKIIIKERPYISYNPYFFIPFFIWVVAGGLGLIFFDRQTLFAMINTRHTYYADIIMAMGTHMGEGYFSIILLSALLVFPKLRNRWYLISAFMSNALPAIITQAIKSGVNEPRPLNYFKSATWIHTLPEWQRYMERSFPSGHTCAAFCLFCFIALFLPHGYRFLGIVLFAIALFVGVTRVYLAAHFFHDIYVGSILGTTFTSGIVYLFEYRGGYFFRYVRKRSLIQ